MNNRKPRTQWIKWLAALAVVAGLAYWAFKPRPVSVGTGRAQTMTLVERIVVEGKFRSVDRWTVTSIADGEIKRMPLEVGDTLSKGQVITEIYWDVRYVPVRSPQRGVVSRVFRESAGPIRRGDPILEVVDPERLEAVAELLTPEAGQVRVGNPAKLLGWGGGSSELEAVVSRVSRAGFVKNSALGVEEERTEVTLLPSAGGVFGLGDAGGGGSQFHVDVEIETARTAGLLCIPVGAVFKEGEGWATYVVRDGRASLTRIEVGRKNEDWIEVRSGLGQGEEVIVYPGDLVRPGSRVAAKAIPAGSSGRGGPAS